MDSVRNHGGGPRQRRSDRAAARQIGSLERRNRVRHARFGRIARCSFRRELAGSNSGIPASDVRYGCGLCCDCMKASKSRNSCTVKKLRQTVGHDRHRLGLSRLDFARLETKQFPFLVGVGLFAGGLFLDEHSHHRLAGGGHDRPGRKMGSDFLARSHDRFDQTLARKRARRRGQLRSHARPASGDLVAARAARGPGVKENSLAGARVALGFCGPIRRSTCSQPGRSSAVGRLGTALGSDTRSTSSAVCGRSCAILRQASAAGRRPTRSRATTARPRREAPARRARPAKPVATWIAVRRPTGPRSLRHVAATDTLSSTAICDSRAIRSG